MKYKKINDSSFCGRLFCTEKEYIALQDYFKLVSTDWGYWAYEDTDLRVGIPVYDTEEETVLEFIKLMENK